MLARTALAAIFAVLSVPAVRPAWSAEADRAPNIVFILADDLGYGDVQALNPHSRIPTPHLNRLAASGMTFVDAHTPSAVCTPTRYGLLTGRYCWRSRLKRGVLNGYSPPLIEPDRPTVASLLAEAGYATAIVGKWHLGLGFAGEAPDFDYSQPLTAGPHTQGFAFSHVIPASLDFPPYVFVRNGRVTQPPTLRQPAQKFPAFLRAGPRSPDLVMENCLDDLTEVAVQYLRGRRGNAEPFFLYFPLTAPHKPVLPHSRFRGRTELGDYGDFVAQVDDVVGRVLKALEESGADGNTLVIFSSDNGSYMYRRDDPTAVDHVDDSSVQAYRSDRHRANHVFRGTKADIWEAGHHVPFFVRWPGRIKPGSQCQETICLTDFYATAAAICQRPPGQGGEDSYSLLPLIDGGTWSRPPVIHHSAAGAFAIRDGRWKLVLADGSGGREAPKGRPFGRPYHLFDLRSDIGEQRNLIDEHADVAQRLERAFEEVRGDAR